MNEILTKPVTRTYTNVDTGESVELTHEEVIKARPRGGKVVPKSEGRFVTAWPENLWRFRLGSRDWQVFWMMATTINLETGIADYVVKDMAEELGMQRESVSRCISNLERKGMVQRLDKSGGRARFNPHLIWRGALTDRRRTLIEMENGR